MFPQQQSRVLDGGGQPTARAATWNEQLGFGLRQTLPASAAACAVGLRGLRPAQSARLCAQAHLAEHARFTLLDGRQEAGRRVARTAAGLLSTEFDQRVVTEDDGKIRMFEADYAGFVESH